MVLRSTKKGWSCRRWRSPFPTPATALASRSEGLVLRVWVAWKPLALQPLQDSNPVTALSRSTVAVSCDLMQGPQQNWSNSRAETITCPSISSVTKISRKIQSHCYQKMQLIPISRRDAPTSNHTFRKRRKENIPKRKLRKDSVMRRPLLQLKLFFLNVWVLLWRKTLSELVAERQGFRQQPTKNSTSSPPSAACIYRRDPITNGNQKSATSGLKSPVRFLIPRCIARPRISNWTLLGSSQVFAANILPQV